MTTIEHSVQTPQGRLWVTEQPGEETPVLLMHGFPDDHGIYNRLIPQLAPRRVIAFDFLGHGRSDRTDQPCFAYKDHAAQISAVLDALEVQQVVLVGHDGSTPEAVMYAVGHPQSVSHLVVLNGPFGQRDAFRMPEMTRLFAEPDLRRLADDLMSDTEKRGWMLQRWGAQAALDHADRSSLVFESILPQFFGGESQPDALVAIRGWTAELLRSLDRQEQIVSELPAFRGAVSVIFGAEDPDLTPALAQEIASLFSDASLALIEGAGHYPQHDEAERVAELIKRPVQPTNESKER